MISGSAWVQNTNNPLNSEYLKADDQTDAPPAVPTKAVAPEMDFTPYGKGKPKRVVIRGKITHGSNPGS